jgi:acyl-lipid omega-6 desaturase (Delta-12 desaturase)
VSSSISLVKAHKRALIDRYARGDNLAGCVQILNTLLPFAALWWAVAPSADISYGLTAGITLALMLFHVRIFVLMHECGHGSLFRTGWLNKSAGFVLGVLSAMPQYVWSRHHAFHHSTNGNWARYRGPLNAVTVDDYAAMNDRQRRNYRLLRQFPALPLQAFLYAIFNPRYTWLVGSTSFLWHALRGKQAEFATRYWGSRLEYWHMTWNNVALLGLWLAMSLAIGPGLFFAVYLVSLTLASSIGIVLFTVQHNFRHSYASADAGWDYDTAAIEGTSYLVLPGWLNWFTANIGYHHVHHLSASIPNYRLALCHDANRHLFVDVPRIGLAGIADAVRHILWDIRARRLVSVAEFESGTLK